MPTIRVSPETKATYKHIQTLMNAYYETTCSEGTVAEEVGNDWLRTALRLMLAPDYKHVDVQKVALRINTEIQAVST